MWIELEGKGQLLLDLLMSIPPDLEAAERFLRTENLTPSEVTRAAIAYGSECFCEAGDLAMQNGVPHTDEIVPDLHSTYIYDVVKLLLQFGLEPNGVYEEYNIMSCLKYVDNEFLAADTLALLLENGGDPHQFLDCEELFEEWDFAVFFDAIEQENRQRYASLVHGWMVLIGYGALSGNDDIEVTLFREYQSDETFDLQKLKNHRQYYFGLSFSDHCITIHIYDKTTLCEVAQIR